MTPAVLTYQLIIMGLILFSFWHGKGWGYFVVILALILDVYPSLVYVSCDVYPVGHHWPGNAYRTFHCSCPGIRADGT